MSWFRRRKLPTIEHQEKPTVSIIDDRRFRVDIPYILPKDFPEHDRLTFQHHFLKIVLGRNFVVPMTQVEHILDVGCGTGIWGRELAGEFPTAQVVGFDIEAPTTIEGPPTCLYVKGDVLQGLPFPDATFDFTHQRLMALALPAHTWPFVIQELARVTRLGGWIELVEVTDTFHNTGPKMQRFLKWWGEASRKSGFDFSVITQLDSLLSHVGLQHVQGRMIRVPLGSWGGRAGELLAKDTYSVFSNLKPMFTSKLKLSPQAFENILGALTQEWNDYQTSFHFSLAYGQKGG